MAPPSKRLTKPIRLVAKPIPHGERGVLARTLAKAKLPVDDVDAPGRLFWRFERADQVPLGFGGLEVHGKDALLRSVLTLPPAQKRGVGTGIVAALELEALAAGAQRLWLLTMDAAPFFARLGYAEHARDQVPQSIQTTEQWRSLCPAAATVMCKRLPRLARKPRRRLRSVE
jgi:N-acetylglutamate synthase-like GNAT family acetyltransferase